MFTEVVKLTPQVDQAGLNSMFANLTSRFQNVAKKFGDGMKNALKFGGIVGLVSALVQKILNPLEKAEEIINRIIDKGDDANTNAEEFQTTPGKLLRGEGVAAAHGVTQDVFRNLVGKFQAALSKEQDAQLAPGRIQQKLATVTDPKQRVAIEAELKQATEVAAQGGPLHEFLNEKDMVTGFFKLIQSLQTLNPAQRTVVENQVFGEKLHGKTTEFFNAKDFAQILKGFPAEQALTDAAVKTGGLADLRDFQNVARILNDFVTKKDLVNAPQISALTESKKVQDLSDNETLKRFENAQKLQTNIDRLVNKADKLFTNLSDNIMPKVLDAADSLVRFVNKIDPKGEKTVSAVKGAVDATANFLGGTASGLVQSFEPKNLLNFGMLPSENLKPAPGPDPITTTLADLKVAIDGATRSIQDVWAEFKTSRVYRVFGK